MTTLKVTILATSYPLTSKSTSGIFIARLVDHFPASVSPTIVTPAMGSAVGSDRNARSNIVVFRYGPSTWEILAHRPGGIPVALRKNKLLYLLVPVFLASMFFKCIQAAKNSEIIHANWAIVGLVAGLAGWILGKPVVTTLRGEDIARAKKNILDMFILKWCLRLNSGLVAVSNSIKIWVDKNIPGSGQKITVIENGIEKELLGLNLSDTKPGGRIRILTIGSLIERKGIDQIIRAMASVNEEIPVRLTIIGDGPEKEKLEALTTSYNIQGSVKFIGEVLPENIPDYLSNTDIFILASHSEGRPNVILEAMAAGLPVISTDIEGSNELIIHNKTGMLFKDGNIMGLVTNIRELSLDSNKRKVISKNARNFIKDNNLLWEQTALKYLNLYKLKIGKK